MAVDRQPVLKRCKALGISPMVLGYSKETNRHANANNRKEVSEYGMQLKEKQKLKFIYGVLEKQFYHYYVKTSSRSLNQDLTTLYSEWVWLSQEEKQDS